MNRVTEILGTKYPLIQGPMGWLTDAKMVAAVSNAGGLGVLGPNAGNREVTPDAHETGERMRREIRKTRELTDKPFAVNYIMPIKDLDDIFSQAILNVCIEENVEIILATGDHNPEIIRKLKGYGFKVIFREVTPNVKHGKEAVAAGADIIAVTGYDEGGCMPVNPVGTLSALRRYVGEVDAPIVVAGGIVDRATANAVMVAGADGVIVGTRFIVSEECPAHVNCKNDIIQHESEDTIVYNISPTVWRSTPHPISLKCKKMNEEGYSALDIAKEVNIHEAIRLGSLEGDFENGISIMSNAISAIKSIMTCEEIVQEIMADYGKVFG